MFTYQSLVLKFGAILLIVSSLFAWHKYEVHRAVNTSIVEQKAEYSKNIQELKLKSLTIENKLNLQVSEIEKVKDAEIKTINTRYNNLLNGLLTPPKRNPSANSTESSTTTESTAGTFNKGLFERHAQVSLGIARDAEELKQQLMLCYTQYDIVYEQLNNYRSYTK